MKAGWFFVWAGLSVAGAVCGTLYGALTMAWLLPFPKIPIELPPVLGDYAALVFVVLIAPEFVILALVWFYHARRKQEPWTKLGVAALVFSFIFGALSGALFGTLTWYGCGPTASSLQADARDLAAFQEALRQNGRITHIRAVAVHGHTIDVVDDSVTPDPMRDGVRARQEDLERLWATTFQSEHPYAWNSDRVMVKVFDRGGQEITAESSAFGCAVV